MKLSKYLLNTLKESPKEAQIISHKLLLRTSMIKQHASGIYIWLPLGLKVLKNIEEIIRKNQNDIGCLELLMPTIQSADLWKKSGRYEDYGKEMLRIKDRNENDLLYGPTNEEIITDFFNDYVSSYKNLPKYLYHIQWKFRDEIRPRFGIMRGREFLMKDAYSFDLNEENSFKTYKLFFKSYLKTFIDLGLKPIPVKASSGAIGGNLSHEFQILANTGESEIAYDKKLTSDNLLSLSFEDINDLYSASDDLIDKNKKEITVGRGIEVGHIFYFGTKYSSPLKANVLNKDGKNINIHMGSYGIGISRLVGAIIEAYHDDKGIKWPFKIAPFKINIIPSNEFIEDDKIISLYEFLSKKI
jgi:prolyl-tRNA synthetase